MTQGIPGTSAMPPSPDVSSRTLELTLGRAFTFLRGLSTNSAIRSLFAKVGYTQADQEEGVRLVTKAAGFDRPNTSRANADDEAARAAITEVDDSDERIFRITAATLTRRAPEQGTFVLTDLNATRGPESVLNMVRLLDRLDALETGTGRPVASRDADLAALEQLSRRGITASERTRLRGLTVVALRAPSVPEEKVEEIVKERQDALVSLRGWYLEWSEVGRAVVTRRDHLISLGLANRRSSSGEEEEEATVPALPVPGVLIAPTA